MDYVPLFSLPDAIRATLAGQNVDMVEFTDELVEQDSVEQDPYDRAMTLLQNQ